MKRVINNLQKVSMFHLEFPSNMEILPLRLDFTPVSNNPKYWNFTETYRSWRQQDEVKHKCLCQHTKKVKSDSLGLAVGLVFLTCTTSKWIFLRNSYYRKTVINPAYQNLFFRLIKMTLRLVYASCSLPEWQTVKVTFFASWPVFSLNFSR